MYLKKNITLTKEVVNTFWGIIFGGKVDKVRSLVRPMLTLTGWLVLLYLAIISDGDIRKAVVQAVIMMVAFWFGQRTKGV